MFEDLIALWRILAPAPMPTPPMPSAASGPSRAGRAPSPAAPSPMIPDVLVPSPRMLGPIPPRTPPRKLPDPPALPAPPPPPPNRPLRPPPSRPPRKLRRTFWSMFSRTVSVCVLVVLPPGSDRADCLAICPSMPWLTACWAVVEPEMECGLNSAFSAPSTEPCGLERSRCAASRLSWLSSWAKMWRALPIEASSKVASIRMWRSRAALSARCSKSRSLRSASASWMSRWATMAPASNDISHHPSDASRPPGSPSWR
jgi:hypothetical protein